MWGYARISFSFLMVQVWFESRMIEGGDWNTGLLPKLLFLCFSCHKEMHCGSAVSVMQQFSRSFYLLKPHGNDLLLRWWLLPHFYQSLQRQARVQACTMLQYSRSDVVYFRAFLLFIYFNTQALSCCNFFFAFAEDWTQSHTTTSAPLLLSVFALNKQ